MYHHTVLSPACVLHSPNQGLAVLPQFGSTPQRPSRSFVANPPLASSSQRRLQGRRRMDQWGTWRLVNKYRSRNGGIQKTIHSWWTAGSGVPSTENRRLCGAQLRRPQPRGRPHGGLVSKSGYESDCRKLDKFGDAELDTRVLRRQHEIKRKQWRWYRGWSGRQGKLLITVSDVLSF